MSRIFTKSHVFLFLVHEQKVVGVRALKTTNTQVFAFFPLFVFVVVRVTLSWKPTHSLVHSLSLDISVLLLTLFYSWWSVFLSCCTIEAAHRLFHRNKHSVPWIPAVVISVREARWSRMTILARQSKRRTHLFHRWKCVPFVTKTNSLKLNESTNAKKWSIPVCHWNRLNWRPSGRIERSTSRCSNELGRKTLNDDEFLQCRHRIDFCSDGSKDGLLEFYSTETEEDL